MKKFITDIKTLAALFIAGASFTACSSDDDFEQQPVNPATQNTYTMTVTASKGKDSALARAMAEAGMTGGNAQTRALSYNSETTTLNAAWADGETVAVIAADATTLAMTECGTLTATVNPSDATEATLSGTLTTAPAEGSAILLAYPRFPWDYTGQKGTLADISAKYDYAISIILPNKWSIENNHISVTGDDPIAFANAQAIVRFNLQDKAGNAISATSLTVHDASNQLVQIAESELSGTFGDLTITPDDASSVIWAALNGVDESSNVLTLTATTDEGDTYTYTTKPSFTGFTRGKFYSITVKMEKSELLVVNDDTSAEVTKGEDGYYILYDNGHYTVSGIGSGTIIGQGVTLTIEDGTVINGSLYIESYNSENIANIILNGDATVNGYIRADQTYTDYTLISSASGNHTLTVNGTARESCWRLAEGVTLRYSDYSDGDFYYGYVKNADGTADITPTSETIGSVTYNVYEGSGTVSGSGGAVSGSGGAVVTVWFASDLTDMSGSEYNVVYNNDETQYPLTATGDSHGDYNCFTATLPDGATTYNVVNPWGGTVVTGVSVAGGECVISSWGNFGYRNWE